jgi:protein involved in plasmid replication-relaxation
MKRRIARERRRAGVHVVLGPRDEALIRTLARFRIARTGDLAELFFRGVRRDTAATRLRRLHDAGFIQARPSGLSEQNVYQLGPEGLCWAEQRSLATGAPPVAPAIHHLAIVRLWARLAATLAAHNTLRLQRFEPDWEVRARVAGFSAPVVPDAVIEIVGRGPGARSATRIALEVDLTTERPGVLRRKLAAYEVSHHFAGGDPVGLVVVLVGARQQRLSSVHSLIGTEWRGDAQVFAESDWPSAILQRLREGPLTGTPSSKGTTEHVTPHGDTLSRRQGEGLSRSVSAADSSVALPGRAGLSEE